ncbi:hypothetical protein [Aliiroseovarius sp.]|uniref:hypothetical protein n=1 Tax=Aliiroseovarius sp. TaxID=1872442 RepID=UPI003BAA1FF3
MKRFAAALAACVISTSATTSSAHAQGPGLASEPGLDGLSFGIEYASYDDGLGFRVDTAEAWVSASFLESDRGGIQVGLGHMSEVGSSDRS